MIVGIDLGTTNSLIGIWKDGKPTLIPNALDKYLTPSVVGIDDNGEILVGEAAKERLITHPKLTVANFKRWMGTNKRTQLGEHSFLPEELSSIVLRALVRDVEQYTGEKVEEAVISVPAYFNDIQRKATRTAGRLAGLTVERIINEPTAAALAYGLAEEDDANILIIDLGGGTFDVSLLEKFDDVLEVHASSGDNHLGGEDFKNSIQDELRKRHDLDASLAPERMSKLSDQIKHALSQQHETTYELDFEGHSIQGTLTRQEFEDITKELLERIRRPLERAIRDSEFEVSDIDHIVLAGGSTRMPMVKNLVGRLFRKLPFTHLDPDQLIAIGATVQASLKERHQDLKDIVLTDVCPYTLGVGTMDQTSGFGERLIMSPIIERNATIPTSQSHRYSTVHPKQKALLFDIYQGESINLENNIKLGSIELTIPNPTKEEQTAEVRFTYDINGTLEVIGKILPREDGKGVQPAIEERKIFNSAGANLTDEEIDARFKELDALKRHPWEQEANRMLLARADRLYEELSGDTKDNLYRMIGHFMEELSNQKLRSPEKLRQEFSDYLDFVDTSVFRDE